MKRTDLKVGEWYIVPMLTNIYEEIVAWRIYSVDAYRFSNSNNIIYDQVLKNDGKIYNVHTKSGNLIFIDENSYFDENYAVRQSNSNFEVSMKHIAEEQLSTMHNSIKFGL